eukprot:CAMPEP_0202963062 /NCGR_PEP_ID=MMETSP1396-20130829/7059_1 /ASSEMBLY_ACC=CAM_ASM_000872 /TAXON_ID= /ORGANISM="Pseudokeronopsis sp., Strain Brazil" /LENGTH=56 /DNA_ID=CAMNT_0049683987 /DNA_START=1062 /DNA_END=1232 /DNA_ORIENTATION=+
MGLSIFLHECFLGQFFVEDVLDYIVDEADNDFELFVGSRVLESGHISLIEELLIYL